MKMVHQKYPCYEPMSDEGNLDVQIYDSESSQGNIDAIKDEGTGLNAESHK